ncbi:unnamed protein product [Darwinula stevensoni]|uniref:Uncharacterized protein n=1 Tax=Darwinula stevensoni TaxID=69355 RepID=A0A7R9FTF8_9CRUS|nr:unnamed protein product [Darwinula stevensoni]CAG0905430.1 unnamed protein product [Darwinula stevensoni]
MHRSRPKRMERCRDIAMSGWSDVAGSRYGFFGSTAAVLVRTIEEFPSVFHLGGMLVNWLMGGNEKEEGKVGKVGEVEGKAEGKVREVAMATAARLLAAGVIHRFPEEEAQGPVPFRLDELYGWAYRLGFEQPAMSPGRLSLDMVWPHEKERDVSSASSATLVNGKGEGSGLHILDAEGGEILQAVKGWWRLDQGSEAEPGQKVPLTVKSLQEELMRLKKENAALQEEMERCKTLLGLQVRRFERRFERSL